jgi:hypothetical protein
MCASVCKGPERDGINSSLCTPGSSQKGATPRQVKSQQGNQSITEETQKKEK